MQANQRVRDRRIRVLATLTISTLGVLTRTLEASAVASPPDASTTALRQTIESRFPGSHVLDLQPSVIPGLYELFMGDQIVYTDATGNYLIVGSMVDTRNKQNLTDAHLNDHGKIDFKTLPVSHAIKVVKGNGSRVFAVFSDPDCPYCQLLEKNLLSINDVTMYVYLFPIASLHPQAPSKARAIWCAPDRAQAWSQWMLEKKVPPSTKACSSDPIDSLQKLGSTLHINSTPTLFFADGTRVAGAISAQEAGKKLSAAATP